MKTETDVQQSFFSWRNLVIAILVFLIFLWLIPGVEQTDPTKSPKGARKLQIGIKKRPEKCERKSTKGDLLHIHYRVSVDETNCH